MKLEGKTTFDKAKELAGAIALLINYSLNQEFPDFPKEYSLDNSITVDYAEGYYWFYHTNEQLFYNANMTIHRDAIEDSRWDIIKRAVEQFVLELKGVLRGEV